MKDLDVRTIESLKQAHQEAHEHLRNHEKESASQPHDGLEWNTTAGNYDIPDSIAKFIRLNHNMLPDFLEAVSILAEVYKVDSRAYETDAECDAREHDMQVAMHKASVLLDKLHGRAAPKENSSTIQGLSDVNPSTWFINVKVGQKLRPIPLWNQDERGPNRLAAPTEIFDIKREYWSQSGIMFKVKTKDGSMLWLDAAWFEPHS